MSPRLDRAELSQRAKNQAGDLILQIAVLLQGGILSAAAFSLIGIFQTQDALWIRLMLWLTSVIIGLLMFFRLCNRALYLTKAGLEVLFVGPLMCLFQIIPFAVLSSTALGEAGWRYWYVADTCVFAFGLGANWLSLRTLQADQYAEDVTAVFKALHTSIRQQYREGVAALLLTLSLTVWILAMPPDWPYATAFVAVHLALTIMSGVLITRQDTRDLNTLQKALSD